MEEVLMSTASFVLRKYIKDGKLYIEYISFPMPKYANYIGKRLILDPKYREVIFNVFHDGWSCGCGSLTNSHILANVHLSEKEFNDIYNVAEKIKTVEGLEDLIEKVEEIQRDIDDEIVDKFERLKEALINLGISKELRELLEDEVRVKQILEEYVSGDC